MPIKSLYEEEPNILYKVCAIRDYINNHGRVVGGTKVLDICKDKCNYVSIRVNTTKSPDGARGMFLLIRREDVRLKSKNSKTPKEQELIEILESENENFSLVSRVVNKNKNEFELMYEKNRKRRQEKFEFYTYMKLKEKEYTVQHSGEENMNDYDFLIDGEIAIEVKSDRYRTTGNIALELLREYDVSNCRERKENMGSILKSKADYWLVYYYDNDRENGHFDSELYRLEDLKKRTRKIIDCIFHKISSRY